MNHDEFDKLFLKYSGAKFHEVKDFTIADWKDFDSLRTIAVEGEEELIYVNNIHRIFQVKDYGRQQPGGDTDSASAPTEHEALSPEVSLRLARQRLVLMQRRWFLENRKRSTRHVGDPTVDGHINWEKLHGSVPEPRITMPPGYRMERVARWIFFFSPKTFRRVSEEIVADYRHEMVEAIGKGAPKAELRRLQFQHWGGFILVVLDSLVSGVVGKLVKLVKAAFS